VPLGIPQNTTLDESEKHILVIEEIPREASPDVNVCHSTVRMVPRSKLSKVLQWSNHDFANGLEKVVKESSALMQHIGPVRTGKVLWYDSKKALV